MKRDANRVTDQAGSDPRPYIGKSKFLSGLQCPKLLWHEYNRKDLIPEPDAATQAIFDQGHEVGQLAKQLFPGGIEVAEGTKDFEEVLQQSKQALEARRPLFEAEFAFGGGYARVDILNPVGQDQWDIIEVKSSTEAKDVNVYDLGFQAYLYTGAGINVRRAILMHIDRNFVRRGRFDPKQFFKKVDLTPRVGSAIQRQGTARKVTPSRCASWLLGSASSLPI